MTNNDWSQDEILDLKKKCLEVRRNILDLTFYGSSSHLGGSLSSVEILTCLLFRIMSINPDLPLWGKRDRLVISKGHAAPGMYAVMAARGFFPAEELKTFGKSGTRLQKHLDMHKLPGIDASSGSLGQGLSIAAGMALADRMDGKERFTYVLMGDGEMQEGQIWEAALTAAQHKLDKIIAFVDDNQMQVDGFTKDILNVEPLVQKWESFGWHVQRIDGSDVEQILKAAALAKSVQGKPHVIIADTIKGKGFDFMELKVEWHSRGLTEDEYCSAINQLAAAEAAFTALSGKGA
ncbi:MAG: transketolase [Anaerolineae bacterium]|nr:transketolase [Anaerolineae bacterium]